jgi:outer membrane protein OmpA-like peptidoglycan-associated protein
MKRAIVISLLSILVCTGLEARNRNPEITVADRSVERSGEQVVVSFRAQIDRRAAASDESVIFAPVITDGNYRWSLPAIVVQGRRAKTAAARHDWAAGDVALQSALDEGAIVAENGSTVDYRTVVDWQPWMNGADLMAEKLVIWCCSQSQTTDLLGGNLNLPPPPVTPVVAPPVVAPVVAPPVVPPAPKTTGDLMAEQYPFVEQYDDSDDSGDRDEAIKVYFRQDKRTIDPSYMNNSVSLAEIIASIRQIQASPDSRVRQVMIAGFASPEGTYNYNDRLAFDRSTVVKRYIMERTGMADGNIAIHSGAEDWDGLRELVEQSDMPSKYQIIDIIDNVPIWNSALQIGREKTLMDLDGGTPYKYMYRHFFPLLRNATYIKIYYDNR